MTTFGKITALLLVSVISTSVSAAYIPYGNFKVTTATFLNVEESGVIVQTDPEVREPLFGAPLNSGNSLVFNPVSFGVYSVGNDSNTLDGELRFELEADPGQEFLNMEFRESGVYEFGGQGTSATSVMANLSVSIIIKEVNGADINDPSHPLYDPLDPHEISFVQNMFSTDLSQGSSSGTWSNLAFRNLYGYFGPDYAITKISVVLDNPLNATSEAGTNALIDKKMFLVKTRTGSASYVPEPSAVVLMGLGALALFFLRRKTK